MEANVENKVSDGVIPQEITLKLNVQEFCVLYALYHFCLAGTGPRLTIQDGMNVARGKLLRHNDRELEKLIADRTRWGAIIARVVYSK